MDAIIPSRGEKFIAFQSIPSRMIIVEQLKSVAWPFLTNFLALHFL